MIAKCDAIAAGNVAVPRTCPVCKLDACKKLNPAEATGFPCAEVVFEGRCNGMDRLDADGAYVALIVVPDDGTPRRRLKIGTAQAVLLGADLLSAVVGDVEDAPQN